MTVKYVELGGEKRPVKFGFNAIIEFGELTNRNIDQINNLNQSNLTLKDMMLLFWCGLKHGARIDKKPFDFAVEDIADWLDENPQAIVEITAEYVKSKSADPGNPALKKKGHRKNP